MNEEDGRRKRNTMEPCPLCLGALYMSSVRQLHYACRDPYAGSVDLLSTTPYLRRKPIQVHGLESPEMETFLMALQCEFEFNFGLSETTRRLLGVWREVLPEGVSAGRGPARSGDAATHAGGGGWVGGSLQFVGAI
jgi:hypothetical protein